MHNTLFTRTTDGSGTGREVKSVGTYRRLVGALVALVAVAVMVLAGCADAGDTAAPTVSITAVTTGSVALASGRVSIPVTNPNTAIVSVRVSISPTVAATYTVNGTAFTNAATTGFTLAARATQTLVISGLDNATIYTVSLTTVGNDGVAHSDAVTQRVVLNPTAFTVTVANGSAITVVTSSNLRTTATVSWTNPSNATVALVAAPATGVTISTVTTTAGAENSVTVSGLTPKTTYTFTVTATNTVASIPATATLTPPLPVVFWEASNAQDGDFGFAYCQTQLDSGNAASSGVNDLLYTAGYRTAKFFGSTPDYNYVNIATDADALGAVGTRPLVTAIGNSFTVPAQISGNPMTLGDFTKSSGYNAGTTTLSNTIIILVIRTLTTQADDRFWSFTGGGSAYDGRNCSNASSNASNQTGLIGGPNNSGGVGFARLLPTCNNARSVLCIAK